MPGSWGDSRIYQPGEAPASARAARRWAWGIIIIWTLAAWTAGFFMGANKGENTWHEASTTS